MAKTKIPSARKHAHFLRMLYEHRNKKGDYKKLMSLASPAEILACCEVMLNALDGNIRLTPQIAKMLKRYRRQCHCLLDKDAGIERKRKILKGQIGGLLPLLAPLIPTLIGTIAKPIIKGLTGM